MYQICMDQEKRIAMTQRALHIIGGGHISVGGGHISVGGGHISVGGTSSNSIQLNL